MPTGTRQIWTVYRLNWWVQTDTTYDQLVQGPRREGPRRAVASAGYVQADLVFRAHPLGGPATRPDDGACRTRPDNFGCRTAACYPTTNSGNCYEPGGYRRTSDRGTYEKIICEDNNGWRWEPVEALNLYDLPFVTGYRFFQILVRQQVQQWQRALARPKVVVQLVCN
jgi:hypothetical protein